MRSAVQGLIVLMAVVVLIPMPAAGQAAGAQGYTPPRTPEGQPNLQGIWQVLNAATWDIQDHGAQLGVPAGQAVVEGNEIPYQPWAAAKKQENSANRATADPETKCYMPGVPRITYMGYPFQILQTPELVMIVYEYIHSVRPIFMDGRPHFPPGATQFWLGESRGRWEGNTLVVDVRNFTDQTWFDRAGNFHSGALRVVERYTPTGPDHMTYEVTIEDAKAFTRPWKMSMTLYRRKEPNARLLEYECYAYAAEEEDKAR